MPWETKDGKTLRREFVELANREGSNVRELCRRYGVSAVTGYKWLNRYAEEGEGGLEERSRRPKGSPFRTPQSMEAAILLVRERHPSWGGRKIRRRLEDQGKKGVPAASTITEILRRHGRIEESESEKRQAWERYEWEAPNQLWQMDFKGHFPIQGRRCHPLSILDDHSRFSVGLYACADERGLTVRAHLERVFDRYGLPERMLMDNGSPWGTQGRGGYTDLEVWLMERGIGVRHGRPCHPQTQGKGERFHRTLKAEAIGGRSFWDLEECQRHFERWREVYNLERPHEALEMATPASRYAPSARSYTGQPIPCEYGPQDEVRKVQGKGEIYFRGRAYPLGKGFQGRRVAVRPTTQDGFFEVYFAHQLVGEVDLTTPLGKQENV